MRKIYPTTTKALHESIDPIMNDHNH